MFPKTFVKGERDCHRTAATNSRKLPPPDNRRIKIVGTELPPPYIF